MNHLPKPFQYDLDPPSSLFPTKPKGQNGCIFNRLPGLWAQSSPPTMGTAQLNLESKFGLVRIQ